MIKAKNITIIDNIAIAIPYLTEIGKIVLLASNLLFIISYDYVPAVPRRKTPYIGGG